MKRSYYSVLALLLMAMTAGNSLANGSTLQIIDFMEQEYFLEGASFDLVKQQNGCLLKGVGYGETGHNQYEFYFDDSGLNKAHYISYRYDKPITEIKNDADMFVVEEIDYDNNSQEDESTLKLFNELTKLIKIDNLSRCSK